MKKTAASSMASGMRRRDFLKWQAKGAALLAAGNMGLRPAFAAEPTPDLAVVTGEAKAAVRASVELLGGMSRFVKPGQHVVIKPNMSFANPPEAATTTHPFVVEALAAMCKEAGASKIDILDNVLSSVESCLERTGIRDACEIIGKDSVRGVVSEEEYRETEVKQGKTLKETDVMKDVLAADVLIAAPVAKHHSSAGVSLSMKGMMGLILNRGVFHWKYDLHEAIVDLAALLTPDLIVVDATRVLTTNGPSGPGKVIKPNVVIAGTDMVASDAMAVSMFEWYGRKLKPRQVKHIRIAHERGLGRMDVENLEVKRLSV